MSDWYKKNPEEHKNYNRQWYLKNRDRILERARKRYAEDPLTNWGMRNPIESKARKYGLSLLEYNEMFESQGSVCAICKKPSDKPYHIDHNHTTGKIRGILCGNCNRGLGLFKDSIEALLNAARYLR